MTYSPIIPENEPSPSVIVTQIQTNFAQFGALFGSNATSNHTALNNYNQGDHETVILQSQSVDPGVTQDLVALYCKNAPSFLGAQPQLFAQILPFLPTEQDSMVAPNTPMQLTYNTVNTAGPQYQSFLPGGYILYWGTTSNIAVNIVLSPTPTNILAVLATSNNQTTTGSFPYTVAVNIINTSTFQIQSSLNGSGPVNPYTFMWLAIAQA